MRETWIRYVKCLCKCLPKKKILIYVYLCEEFEKEKFNVEEGKNHR